MKTVIILLSTALAGLSAFGQGKFSFANDSNHLVYFTYDTAKMVAGDASLAGYGVYGPTLAQLGGAPTLSVTLWGGASANSLSELAITSPGSTSPGMWTPVSVTDFWPPGAQSVYYQVQVFDARAGSAQAAWAHAGWYAGESVVFTASPPEDFLLDWPRGSMPVRGAAGYGAIEVWATIPEPNALALAGLGAAALTIARRRR